MAARKTARDGGTVRAHHDSHRTSARRDLRVTTCAYDLQSVNVHKGGGRGGGENLELVQIPDRTICIHSMTSGPRRVPRLSDQKIRTRKKM